MKTIKTVKLKTTKNATKASVIKTPAAIRPAKRLAKAASDTAPTVPQLTAPSREITTELIAERAYIIWEQQGRPQGSDLANWLLAEQQLQQEIQSFTA